MTDRNPAARHYFTARKAAAGLGAAGTGTAQHWAMTVSAVALALLTPFAVAYLARGIGLPPEGVVRRFGQPLAAIVLGLFVVVGMIHWMRGTRILIDDYVRGAARTWALIAVQIAGWAVIAAAVYALVRMALIAVAL